MHSFFLSLRKLLPVAAFFCCVNAMAQFSDSIHYYTGLTSTGTYNRTNASSSYLYDNAFKFNVKRKDLRLNSTNKWLYGKQDHKLTNNDVSSSLDADLYKTFPHFYYWGLLNYTSSYSLKINEQLQSGLGLAYNVLDKKMFFINISDGVLYEYNDIIVDDSINQRYSTPRNSFRLQVKWNIKDRLVFSGTGFLQNSLQDANDYIIRSDLSLSVKIRKWLSITSAYSYNRMERTRSENVLLTYGLTIEKYF